MHQTGKFFSFILLGLGCLCLISGGILIGRQMSATPKAESSAPEEVPYEQEKITDAEVTGEFYYEQLSDEEQTVYREILQGIQENKKEIYLHCSNANTANEVFQNVLMTDRKFSGVMEMQLPQNILSLKDRADM